MTMNHSAVEYALAGYLLGRDGAADPLALRVEISFGHLPTGEAAE